MSDLNQCCTPCATVAPTQIPGPSGSSAVSETTASFVIPAIGATVNVDVTDTSWMVVNGLLWTGGANFQLTAINGITNITIKYLGVSGDTAAGATVVLGSIVLPGPGNLTFPISIANGGTGNSTAVSAFAALIAGSIVAVANGGTGGTTKTLAQSGLGLGQNGVSSNSTGLAQAVTATPALIAGATITIPATGRYLILARASVDMTGVTFAASRTVPVKIRNVTTATDLSTSTKNTGAPTTTGYPTFDWSVAALDVACNTNDQIQVFISVSVVPSAGTMVVSEATIIAIPLRQS